MILGSNESFTQIIFEKQSISDKQFQYTVSEPPLENGINYFWKVIAYGQNGESLGDYSATARFSTPSGIIEIEFIYDEGGD